MTKVIVASNRSVDESCPNENLFGHGFNAKGPCEVRIAKANKESSQSDWTVTLFADDHGSSQPHQNVKDYFASVVTSIRNNSPEVMKWVLLVPGYCSPCPEGLSKASQLVHECEVNVILFSWPSDPIQPEVTPISKYRETQDVATRSADALRLLLSELTDNFITPAQNASNKFRISLITHSLGNYLLECLVRKSANATTSELSKFDNVILHQADVDFEGHQDWVSMIKPKRLTCITTNLYDATLGKFSDLINRHRLGTEPTGVYTSNNTIHVDFTGARHVTIQHWFFSEIDNRIIQGFCRAIAQGESGVNFLYPDPAHPGRYQAKPFVNDPGVDPRKPGLH